MFKVGFTPSRVVNPTWPWVQVPWVQVVNLIGGVKPHKISARLVPSNIGVYRTRVNINSIPPGCDKTAKIVAISSATVCI